MKSKIFLYVNISGVFFLLASGLKLSIHALARVEDFSKGTLEAMYYIDIFSDISLLIGAIFLIVAGSNYSRSE